MKKTNKKKTTNITIFAIIGIALLMLIGLIINKDPIVYKGINLNEPEKDLNKVYQAINEWKTFCHAQIAKGKLDVIA